MAPRPKLPVGIARTGKGYRVFVRVHHGQGGLRSKLFPLSATITEMKQWREDTRVAVRQQPIGAKPDPPIGFAADAETYLKAVKAMPSYQDRARDIQLWVDVFGETPRKEIPVTAIAAQLAMWAAKKAASTLNHRRTAMMHLYRVLDGKSAANPIRDIPKYREPEPQPRGVSYAVIDTILGAMRDSKTKALLAIIAATGFTPAMIKKMDATHLKLDTRQAFQPGRKKGGGTKGRWMPISGRAVEAFKLALREDLFGHVPSRGSVRKSFRLACDHVCDDGALDGIRPYDLRHSFGSAVYEASGDIRATQILMGHTKAEMTHRYTLGAIDHRVTEALTQYALRQGERSQSKVTPTQNPQ